VGRLGRNGVLVSSKHVLLMAYGFGLLLLRREL
jgi:hypothetical protein